MEFFCNLCSVQLNIFEDPPLPYSAKGFFAECTKHIFCESCKEKIKPQCLICKEPTKFVEIQKNMETYYRWYFESLVNVDQVRNSVENFQDFHRTFPSRMIQPMRIQIKRLADEIAEKQKSLDRDRVELFRKENILKQFEELFMGHR